MAIIRKGWVLRPQNVMEVAAFDFATVSCCDQLIVGPTHARGGTLDLLMTDVPETGMFLWMSSPLIRGGPLLNQRCSARVHPCLCLLVRVVDRCASRLVRLICYWIILTARSPGRLLVCRSVAIRLLVLPTNSYVYKNFRGVKIFHLLFGAIRLLEYILLIMEQIVWVSRWFVLKTIYCENVFVTESHGVYYFTTFVVSSPVPLLGKTGHYIWSDLNYVDTI